MAHKGQTDMSIWMYIRIYIYVYTYVHGHMDTWMRTSSYVYIYIYISMAGRFQIWLPQAFGLGCAGWSPGGLSHGGSQVFGIRVCSAGPAVGEQHLSVGLGPFGVPKAPRHGPFGGHVGMESQICSGLRRRTICMSCIDLPSE